MAELLTSWLWPALVALAPAAVKWALDRRLARRTDDPAFPERLMAQGQRVAAAVGVCVAVTIWFWPERQVWAAPLMLVGVVAAGFPLRRQLLGETWSLAAYLWFLARLLFATQGVWILLVVAPAVTDRPGWAGWASAAVIAAVLLAWNERFGDVVRGMLRASPLQDPDLRRRITELVDRTSLPMPRVDVVPMNGGVFANAAALPSLRQSGVLFSDTLLNRFTPDEVTAITAHELAHLEQFNPRRLQWIRLSAAVLIVLVVVLAPGLRALGLAMTWRWGAGVVVLVLGYLVAVGYKRQQYQTASDLRAVALTRNPEPLVSALVKLHLLARLPRRWDQSVEHYASHPSLARRVKAIRDAVASEPVGLVGAPTFDAADGSGRSVRFDNERVVWSEPSGSMHALPYARLSELRVKPGRGQSAELVAVDDDGRLWSLPLQPADLARVQSVLDIVDVRLSYANPPASTSPITTLTVLLAALVAGTSGQIAAAVLMLVATFVRSSPIMAAAGAAALAASLVVMRDGGASFLAPQWAAAVVLLLSAVFLLSIAWRSRHTVPTKQAGRVVAAMALFVLVLLVPLATSSSDSVGFHQAARAWPAFTIVAAGLAMALFLTRARGARHGGAVAAVAATATLIGGSSPFLEKVITDPLLVDAPLAHEVTVGGEPVARIDIPIAADELLLSPGGQYVAAVEGESEHPRRFHVWKPGGEVRVITTEWAAFADDRTLMTSEQVGDTVIVRRIDLDSPGSSAIEHRVPAVTQAQFSLDAAAGRWRILGSEPDDALLSIEGSVDGGETSRARWGAEVVRGLYPVAVDGVSFIGIESHYSSVRPKFYWLWQLLGTRSSAFTMPRYTARLWRVRDDQREALVDSALSPDCGEISALVTCAAYDGSRTHVVRVAMDTGAVVGLARFPHRLLATERQPGWFSGFLSSGDAVALHVDTATLLRAPEEDGEFTSVVTGAARRVATLSVSSDASTIRVYDLPWPQSAAASRP